MGKEDMASNRGGKRKTPQQIETLENFYSEENYPSLEAMEDLSLTLNLTCKQVRGWFVERRRRDKKEKGFLQSTKKMKSLLPPRPPRSSSTCKKMNTRLNLVKKQTKNCKQQQQRVVRLQRIFTRDYILKKVFRKDGPPLGTQFDTLPLGAFRSSNSEGPKIVALSCVDNQRVSKRRKSAAFLVNQGPALAFAEAVFSRKSIELEEHQLKYANGLICISKTHCSLFIARRPNPIEELEVSKSPVIDFGVGTHKNVPVMKHGIGKGLMTIWHATNPGARGLPSDVSFIRSAPTAAGQCSAFVDSPGASNLIKQKSLHPGGRGPCQNMKRSQHHRLVAKQKERLKSKLLDRKKCAIKSKQVENDKVEKIMKSHHAECKLALECSESIESSNVSMSLVDDEELELRELQAGPNPLTCSAHLTSSGMHGCSLCKDLLARFPPYSVKMKQPLSMRPWGSSPELVKKLFKVFRFLYTHATIINMCPFTLDEFAQAFHDKDSLLLANIHMALLKLLLSDVEEELSNGLLPRANKDYRFIGFLHAVKCDVFIPKMWNRSLNPLTWAEVLRQILVAAGFSSKQRTLRNEPLNKEEIRMAEYGLCPGTLKGELFNVLSKQGNTGFKVTEMAKSFRVAELQLAKTSEELELLICSTLSSDITLFEKISPSAYRLRMNPMTTKGGDIQLDSEDTGSVDDDSGDNITDSSSDEFDMASQSSSLSLVKRKWSYKRRNSTSVEYTEIDESHSGEVWALGLMEGEYSDLSIEEKLNALVALVDLTSAVSSIRMEDPARIAPESMLSSQHHCGAKIKRSSAKQHGLPKPNRGHTVSVDRMTRSSDPPKHFRKADVSSKKNGIVELDGSTEKEVDITKEVESYGHPLKSICLGSDRRFNSYWLFLGPCNGKDPGHRRVYFESSEDGHWEVIDTEEALCALLSVLDGRGMRESCLFASLEKRESLLCAAMSNKITSDNEMRQPARWDQSRTDITSSDGSSPISDVDNNSSFAESENESLASLGSVVLELGRKGEEQKRKWDRLQAFDVWLWKSFYSNLNAARLSNGSYLDSFARCVSCHDLYWRDEKHCKTCHTTFELDFDLEERYAIHVATCREQEGNDSFPKHKVLSSQLQTLKAALHAIETVMLREALVSAWTMSDHKLWVMRLRRTSSFPEFLQVLTDFVGAINEEWLSQCSSDLCSNSPLDDIIIFFPTIPKTTSAVALWLVKLDSLITPQLERVHSERKKRHAKQKER